MEIDLMRGAAAPPGASLANREPGVLIWMSVAFGIALALAIAVLAVLGANTTGIASALRLTARWSFLLFFLAYVGGAAFSLFGPTFAFLAQRQRQFGLSFAAAHLVHIGLALWLYGISAQQPLSDLATLKFSVGAICIYTLALYSVDTIRRLIRPGLWRVIRVIALEYIAYLFLVDFTWPLRVKFQFPIAYVPFAIMIMSGIGLRITAWILTRNRSKS